MNDDRPSLSNLAGEVSPRSASASRELAELVDRLFEQIRAGQAVDLRALVREHPMHAAELERLLPVSEALAWLGVSAVSSAAPFSAPASATQLCGVLGDFRLLREIGRGGMGIVYEAEQISLGRSVALKVLPFASTVDERAQRRFKNEAMAAAQLDHPHIVDVYGVGCERGVHYYAMRLIDGRTLTELIDELRSEAVNGPRESNQAAPALATTPIAQAGESTRAKDAASSRYRLVADLGRDVAEALEHAHAQGIVHRDIKPANLLLDRRGKIWVADFGLAHLDAAPSLTQSGDLVGTLRYMSPEQALGNGAPLDHRTDIYSLGATLYELLTLEPAMSGRDRQELLRQIAGEDPLPPRKIEGLIPADLETIVLKALSKDASGRYATAAEMAADLGRYLAHQPISARPPSLVDRLKKWARRHQPAVAAAVAAAVGLLLISVVLLAVSTLLIGNAQRRTAEALEKAERSLTTARQESERAEQNFQTVMEALDRLLTQVAQGPLARQELESVRREILEDALQFFERLLEKNGDDPALRYETAWARLRVGQIRFALGQGAQAREEAQRAIALLEVLVSESPDRVSYRYTLALGAISLADVQTDARQAETLLQRAGIICEELVADEPDKSANRVLLANVYERFGYLYGNEGRISDAERAYERSLSSYRQLNDEQGSGQAWANAETKVLNSLGLLLRTDRRYSEAEQAHRRALALLSPETSSGSEGGTTELARTNFHLGLVLWRLRRDDQAENAIREALALRERLLARSPGSRFDRVELALTRQTLSVMLEQTGRLPEAETARRLACDELSSLASEYPAVTEYRDLAGRAQVYLGHLLWNSGRTSDARNCYRTGAELLERDRTEPSGGWIPTGDASFLIATFPEAELIDAAKGVRLAKQALEAAPHRSSSRTALGATYYRAGDMVLAIDSLLSAIETEPRENAAPALFLAMTYARQGKLESARRSLADAVRKIDEERPLDPALLRLRQEAEALLAELDPPGDRP